MDARLLSYHLIEKWRKKRESKPKQWFDLFEQKNCQKVVIAPICQNLENVKNEEKTMIS